ncbi:MAG: hypothetical protein OXC82_11730 [Rhodobacteraceae bacterium]|nr:hypothetical protein [Paracoccaceae bacterium]MCY4251087.1 hypothetical protein [Paracoccaceae bacterium]MCY4308137.1 hypothetical protein [Paracoccaceae bacterium]
MATLGENIIGAGGIPPFFAVANADEVAIDTPENRQHEHGNEIRKLGTLIPEYVASIVRPDTKLYYTAESWPKCRLLAWNQNGRGILELRENNKYGKHWSIITVFPEKNPAGRFVGTIL